MKSIPIFRILSVVVLTIILSGCSSGGGGGGKSSAEEQSGPQLSVQSAYPGEFITISDESVKAGETSAVSFKGAGGYEVSFDVQDTVDGKARFPVPVYVNPSTGAQNGAVTVSVNGKAAGASFTIKSIPDLEMPAGDVYVTYMEKVISELESTKLHLQQTRDEESMDFLDSAVAKIDAKIAWCNDKISQIRTTRTLTLTTNDGKAYTLSEDNLKMLDQWLAAWILGMDSELTSPAAMSAEGLNMDNWINISSDERERRIRGAIDHVLDEFNRGLEGGKVYIGGVSLGFALAGFMVGGPAGAIIAGAAGLALAYTQAGYELGTAAIFERMCQSFSSKSREAYDWSKGIMNQAISIATSGLSTLEGKIGDLFNYIDTFLDVKDVVEAAENTRCQDYKGSFVMGASSLSALSIKDFCGGEIVISTDSLAAEISISGASSYSRSFSPAHVLATFTSISDGEKDVMTGIPAIIGSDISYTLESVWQGDILILMFNPNLSGPFPDEIAVYDLWLIDGGYADITFSTPSLKHDTPLNDPVVFKASAEGGTITLEAYGTGAGELIKGTFSIKVEAELDHWDYAQDDYGESDYLTGTISGSFEGILSEPPAASE